MKTKTNMKAGGLLAIGVVVAIGVAVNLGGGCHNSCDKRC